ncbi:MULTISPECIES: hypothetical protein [Kribbella]|jgi:hypothetical protein|uniref:DUF4245 domain-containing protein n=1 Tax=Kribbella pratensis TaxID=2512112 RepID=A0ABY2FGN5_9ACTN|nr:MULTISPECIES: hypothetical protein [Kribbella]TDW90280.1 hypothetical protein EV137_4093 [Kribbella pratensis]TDW98002.1 hypothetical protein EV647_2696 [Kribbella sp. VKM Ac-2566]
MLTPRHQALLMTLAGMTVGVAVFGTVVAVNGGNPFTAHDTPVGIVSPSPSGTPSRGDGLQADGLQYVVQNFGTDDDPVSSEVPAGWKSAQSGTRPKFVDPTGVWQIRFDTRGSKQTPDELVANRERSIDEPGLKVLSRDNGTLVYTYVDQSRGPRMGLSRWVSLDDGKTSAVEITVGGRPQDEAGLRAVLQQATDTLKLPVDPGDDRPN